jgi:hypothetical protein
MNKIIMIPTSADNDMTSLYFDVDPYELIPGSYEAEKYGRYFELPGKNSRVYKVGRYRLALSDDINDTPWIYLGKKP